jgi:hypothetical protein
MVVLYVRYGTHLGLHMTVNRKSVTEGGHLLKIKQLKKKKNVFWVVSKKDNVT